MAIFIDHVQREYAESVVSAYVFHPSYSASIEPNFGSCFSNGAEHIVIEMIYYSDMKRGSSEAGLLLADHLEDLDNNSGALQSRSYPAFTTPKESLIVSYDDYDRLRALKKVYDAKTLIDQTVPSWN